MKNITIRSGSGALAICLMPFVSLHASPVLSAQSLAAPTSASAGFQFEDGGIKDMSTSIVWEYGISSGQWSWPFANAEAESRTTGGFSDWVLPSRDAQVTAALNGLGQHVLSGSMAFEWSSTSKGNKAWMTRMFDGQSILNLKSGAAFIRANRYAGPTSISASAVSTSEIDVMWQDNSEVEAGVELQRSTDGVSWAFSVELGPNVSVYADSGLAKKTKYYYRVRAIRAPGTLDPGDAGWLSPYTEAISEQTKRR
jgi:hypothetical protein